LLTDISSDTLECTAVNEHGYPPYMTTQN